MSHGSTDTILSNSASSLSTASASSSADCDAWPSSSCRQFNSAPPPPPASRRRPCFPLPLTTQRDVTPTSSSPRVAGGAWPAAADRRGATSPLSAACPPPPPQRMSRALTMRQLAPTSDDVTIGDVTRRDVIRRPCSVSLMASSIGNVRCVVVVVSSSMMCCSAFTVHCRRPPRSSWTDGRDGSMPGRAGPGRGEAGLTSVPRVSQSTQPAALQAGRRRRRPIASQLLLLLLQLLTQDSLSAVLQSFDTQPAPARRRISSTAAAACKPRHGNSSSAARARATSADRRLTRLTTHLPARFHRRNAKNSNHGSYYFAEINFHDFSRPN